MFSVSPAEVVTIAIIALVVFGPKRLPEIARKAGRVLREVRSAAADLRAGIESEYGEALRPLDEAGREVRTVLGDLSAPPRTAATRPAESGSRSEDALAAPDDDPADATEGDG